MFFAKVTPTFLLSVPLVVFSCRTETLSGGLMLQIDQDGTLELDEIRVWVGDVDGKELADESYRGEDVQDLPKTVRIANGQPERDVMLRVSAWNTETPLDVRDLTVLDVPNDSVKTVTITLSAQCSDAVKLEGGQAVSKCELGQTCDPASGDCISSEVDGGDLPDFVPEEGLGGDTGAGNGDGTGGNEGSGGVQVSSSAGPDYAQELGAACKKTGAVTCDRNSARQTLICIRGEWDSNGGCDKDEACDPEVGACAPLVPECAGREPGGRYCEGDDLFTCGPNLVSVELDEECPGLCVTTTTSAKCAPATCGDGKEQANEDCDDGDKDNDDDCTQLCKPPKCGDGFEQTGEVCDDGNRVDGDGCSANCTSNERCGNDIIDINARKPEVCDDANTTPGDGCSADCLSNEVCGNGIVDDVNVDTQQPEACDDGNVMDSGDVCSNSCTLNLNCGNGVVDEGEDCDTSLTRPEICTSACQF
ncbi:MAG TPA: hypothetical protein VN764_08660, partial [Polyangiaceae bacterium]|nr:hypothetical protein [Polyangiaceae bacterium]